MDISIHSLIEGANFSDACCSACHAAVRILPYRQTCCLVSVTGIQSLVLLWHMGTRGLADDSCGCCGRGRVVASGVFPVSLPAPRGCDRACRAGRGVFSNAYAGACAVCRKRASGWPGVPVTRRCVCAGMRGPADAGRLYRCPVPSVWVVYAAACAKEWIA